MGRILGQGGKALMIIGKILGRILDQGGKILMNRGKIIGRILGQDGKILIYGGKILGPDSVDFGCDNPQHLDLGHDLDQDNGQDFFAGTLGYFIHHNTCCSA